MAMGRLGGALAIFLCAVLVMGAGGASAKADPGKKDLSFGTEGIVLQYGSVPGDGRSSSAYGEDMAVGSEDAIFLLQSYRTCGLNTCAVDLFVQRYLPDGVLDESFGEKGMSSKVTVITPTSSQQSFGGALHASLAVNSAGEPVVAAVNGGDLTLFRLDQSGKLAGDFGGGDGLVTTDFGNDVIKPQLAISSDGRIVVATGFWERSGDRRFVILARYESNGDLDPSFGAGTPESEPAGWMAIKGSRPAALALAPGGGIALAGGRCCPPATQTSVYLGRRGSNGRPLFPYSPSSPWRYFKVGEHATVTSVAALPRGKVYLVGYSRKSLFAARILPSGRPDRSFGRAGMVRLKKMFAGDSPAVADRAGRLYVAGWRPRGEEFAANRALLARLTRSGRLDRGWGDDPGPYDPPGYTLLPVWISDAMALAFQSDGKLVVFGELLGGCVRTCPRPARTLTRLFTGPVPRRR
jgi:uncharacterized delta-60 repeat protein